MALKTYESGCCECVSLVFTTTTIAGTEITKTTTTSTEIPSTPVIVCGEKCIYNISCEEKVKNKQILFYFKALSITYIYLDGKRVGIDCTIC